MLHINDTVYFLGQHIWSYTMSICQLINRGDICKCQLVIVISVMIICSRIFSWQSIITIFFLVTNKKNLPGDNLEQFKYPAHYQNFPPKFWHLSMMHMCWLQSDDFPTWAPSPLILKGVALSPFYPIYFVSITFGADLCLSTLLYFIIYHAPYFGGGAQTVSGLAGGSPFKLVAMSMGHASSLFWNVLYFLT